MREPSGSPSLQVPWRLPSAACVDRGARLARELGLPDCAGAVLLARGVTDAEEAEAFLDLDASVLHPPTDLPDLDGAATRLLQALDRGERVVVHGDYDADGICGSALLTRGLRRLGADVGVFVPDRTRDGYGVATRLVDHAAGAGVKVMVTVDTGSSADEALARAAAAGIETVVCDHHLFERRPPQARWFVNPQRADSAYPHRELCGSAIAFKLLEEVARRRAGEFDLEDERSMAAIATLADQVPLGRENRALVRMGLAGLDRTRHPGLRALLEVCRIRGAAVEAEDVAYQIAPRLNAAGRMESARSSVDLLLAEEPGPARELAQRLDLLNRRRRELDRAVSEAAIEAARAPVSAGAAGLVLADAAWPFGVVGIAAARVVEAFGRPTVLLSLDGEAAVGSARSAYGLDLMAALDACADLFERHGGHAAAAGLRLRADRIDEFALRFDLAVRGLGTGSAPGGLEIDATLDAAELGGGLADFLYRCGPFGTGNPAPVFAGLGLRPRAGARVVGDGHLKFEATQGGRRVGFIGFSMAARWREFVSTRPRLDAAFELRHRPGTGYDPWELTLKALRESEREGEAEN